MNLARCVGEGYTADMIGRLNHVGVATPSIAESVKLYRDVLGATKITEAKAMPEQGVYVCFVDLPKSTMIKTLTFKIFYVFRDVGHDRKRKKHSVGSSA